MVYYIIPGLRECLELHLPDGASFGFTATVGEVAFWGWDLSLDSPSGKVAPAFGRASLPISHTIPGTKYRCSHKAQMVRFFANIKQDEELDALGCPYCTCFGAWSSVCYNEYGHA